jgi:hypothetical protein
MCGGNQMMNGTLLYDLSLMNITTEKLISNIKRYINQKYYLKSENYRDLVFFDALYKIIDKDLPNIETNQKSKLRQIIINETIKNDIFIISKLDVFKSTLKLNELGSVLVKEFCQWLNISLNSTFSYENVFKMLLFSKKSFTQNPLANVDEIIAEVDEKMNIIDNSNKNLFIPTIEPQIYTNLSLQSDSSNLIKVENKANFVKDFSQNIIDIINSIIKSSLEIKQSLKSKISSFINEILNFVLLKLENFKFKKSDLKYFIENYESLVNKYSYYRNLISSKVNSFEDKTLDFIKSGYNNHKITKKDIQKILNYLDYISDNFIENKENIYRNLYISKELFLDKINSSLSNVNFKDFNFKNRISLNNNFLELNINNIFIGYILIFTLFEILSVDTFTKDNFNYLTRMSIVENMENIDNTNLNTNSNLSNNTINKYFESSGNNILKLGNYEIKEKINLEVSAFSTSKNTIKNTHKLIVGKSISSNSKSFDLGEKVIIKFSDSLNYLDGIYTIDSHDNTLPDGRISIFVGEDEINDSRISKYANDFGINKAECYLVFN